MKYRYKFFIIGIIALFFSSATFAQEGKMVAGIVTDGSTNSSLPGVNISVKGTTIGTSTGSEGDYSLTVPSLRDTLVFSFIGYQTRELPINGRTEINIQLLQQTVAGEELVVVGYGTQKKTTLTGSVSDIEGTTLEKSPSISLTNTFSGKLPGLVAQNRSGEPGENFANLLIRGRSTLGNNDPLIVIDGVPGREGLNNINPNDVASISVLKDASAAIYGARAANGVILVTTKRGVEGKPTISYSANQGFIQPTRMPEMADAATYADFLNYQAELNNEAIPYTQEDIEKYRNGSSPLTHPNTDWVDASIKDFSTQSRQNLSVSGGSDAIRYFISGNYLNQESIFKNGIHNYNVMGGRANIDATISDDLTVSVDFSVSEQNQKRPQHQTRKIVEYTFRNYPNTHDFFPTNGLPSAGSGDRNTAILGGNISGYRNEKTNLYQTSVSFEYDIPFVDGLGLESRISYDKEHIDYKEWATGWTLYNYNPDTDSYPAVHYGPTAPQLTERNDFRSFVNGNIRLTYQKGFADHQINTFIAMEQTEEKSNFLEAYRRDFTSDAVDQIFAGSTNNMQTDGSETRFARRNFFGRVSYNFDEKYLIDFNARYDGSTNFPADDRYGFFPGVSAGWVMSKESFMQSANFIDNLKLRASWGQMGNDQIIPFQYLATYNLTQGAVFGTDKTIRPGTERGVEPNPNVTWEIATTTNLGLDAEFWDGLLGITLDAFKTRRENILTPRIASVPAYAGLELPDENLGIVENKGFELALTHRNRATEGLNYSIRGNVSYAKNKIINMDEAIGTPDWQSEEGKPMGSTLLYNAIGIYRSQEEIDNSPHPPGTRVYDLKYEDVNGDGNINSLDRVRMPMTATPEVIFGANFSIWYENFDLNVFFQGQTRAWKYFWIPQGRFGNVIEDFAQNRPGPNNPNSKYPHVYSAEDQISAWESDFWLYDASFIRLKNVELGYTLANSFIQKIGLQSTRVYINGFNLLTFLDELDYVDPEGDEFRGSHYPQNRVFNFGINITL